MPKNAESNNNPTAPGSGSSSSSSTSAPPPPWIELPKDLALNILRRLNQVEILESAQYVCTTWMNLCCEPSLWRVIELNHHSVYFAMVKRRRNVDISRGDLNNFYDRLCCRAVDRSQGELIDIIIRCLGSDELLRYISDRSSHLKRLTLDACDISPEGLIAAIKNFPCLEELHLVYFETDFDFDIEAISVSCPLLNSFSFHRNKLSWSEVNNSEALSIAKNMPNLCRLNLYSNCLNNEGLQAILDGCLKLQSLDIRQCFHVDLKSDFGKMCIERIKDLKWDDPPYYESDDDDDDDYDDDEWDPDYESNDDGDYGGGDDDDDDDGDDGDDE